MSTLIGQTPRSSSECGPTSIPSRRRRPRRARSPRLRSTGGGNAAIGILSNASNIAISGGQFTTPQASVTVNINHPDLQRSPQVRGRSEERDFAPANSEDTSRVPQRRAEEEQCAQASSQCPRGRKSSAEIYRAHLGKPVARGHPLWIPQVNQNLPKEYRAQGVLIGDVGIFTPEGGFDFLFNILLPASDPINPRRLPQAFAPLSPPLEDIDIRKLREFGAGSYLSSSSVSQVHGGASRDSGTVFESTASEGAVLMMPDGASVEELSNISIFREMNP